MYADSNAAIGIAQRTGKGKVRHLRVQALWVQEVRCTGRLRYKKVLGTRNPADILTKHVPKDLLNAHIVTLGIDIRGGRAETAPTIDSIEAYTEEWEETLETDETRREDSEAGGGGEASGRRRAGDLARRKVRFNRVVTVRPIAAEGSSRSLRDARAEVAKRKAARLDKGAIEYTRDPG